MRQDSDDVNRNPHIEEMKAELEELSDGRMAMELGDEMPPEMAEAFLENVMAFERAEMVRHRELVERDGVALPEPDELTDDELAAKLGEVIQALANRRTYLEGTNHLSDREFYTHLWQEVLNESTPDLPPDNPMNCHIDMVGSGSEEDIALYLKYYADDKTRAHWAEEFPEMTIPPHEDPPYDRDSRLPKPAPPSSPYDDPAVTAAWWAECRGKLMDQLAADGVKHGVIDHEPLSYAPGMACVWSVERLDSRGTVDWWAISGDVPTTYLPTTEVSDPRTFLGVVGQNWRAAADAMASGNPPLDLAIGAPKDWPRITPILRSRADILDEWAADDAAWEEERSE